MNIQVEQAGKFIHKLSVVVPADDVEKAFNDSFKKVAKSAQIPGFRPGKAPKSVLEAHYGPQVTGEVFQQLLESNLQAALALKELSPVVQPTVDPGELKRGAEFCFTAEVEIQPDITITRYEGLEVEAVPVVVEDADLEAELGRIAEQSSQVVPVSGRDVVEKGDQVQLDYSGSIEGEKFDGGQAENAMVEAGGDGYIDGFSDGLIGATVPGEVIVNVTFPEDYHAEELAGKPAAFVMNLKELKVRETPELNDEMAQDMGEENLDALKSKIREGMEHRKKHEAEDQERKNLLQALVRENPFDVAPSMIEEQLDRMVEGATQQLQQYTGNKMEFNSEEMAGIRDDEREPAEFQVRSGLLLLEVSKAAEIEVGYDVVQAEIQGMAERAGDNSERVLSYYSNPQEMMRLHYRLLEQRTVDYLREKSSLGPTHECDAGNEDGED